MNMRSVLFFLGLVATATSFALELDDASVTLKAVSRVSGGEYFIRVQCTGYSITLMYRSKDSISSRLEEDANYIACRKKLLAGNAATSDPAMVQYL